MTAPPPHRALADASPLVEAADAAVAALAADGLSLSRVYLAVAGRLRCIAQRGYRQVHDGVPFDVGVLGRAFTTGRAQELPDVAASALFVSGAAGVVAEVAQPLRLHGRVVGVLDVESRTPLTARAVMSVRRHAAALEARLAVIGGLPEESPWQRLAREAGALAGLHDRGRIVARGVGVACGLTAVGSALLVVTGGDRWEVAGAHGELAHQLRALDAGTLAAVGAWSTTGGTVYTAGGLGEGCADAPGLATLGLATLVMVPLPGQISATREFLLLADRRPRTLRAEELQVLELFAAHLATALQAADALGALRVQAARDVLTGLGHHGAFSSRLEAERSRPRSGGLAVLNIDVDDFKQVNDRQGHLEGDQVLVELAALLSGCLREPDVMCRIGGDEFAAIVSVDRPEQAVAVAERMRALVAASGRATLSVGVAFSPPSELPGTTSEALRKDADLAMYEAKRGGRNRVVLSSPELRAVVLDRARLVSRLASAVGRDELVLDYQPVVDLHSGELLGCEALVRWRHPDRGVLQPGAFIPAAEEDGQIATIGAWVLETACREARPWLDGGDGPGRKLGVNVSGVQLDSGFPDLVAGVLRDARLPMDRLVLEITESAMVEDDERIRVLSELRRRGVHVAIDDFGTGYSSLSYLRRLPIDILKVDRSFVAGLDDPRNAAIARTIIELSRTLGLSSVAEGVERAEQAAKLLALGCDHAQGFLFGAPGSASQLLAPPRPRPLTATSGPGGCRTRSS